MNREMWQKSVPTSLAQIVSGYVWREIHVGYSAARVFRLEAANEKSLYLKIAARAPGDSLAPEKSKLEWLKNQFPVPEVVLFAADETTDYLLIREISGAEASDEFFKENAANVIEQSVKGLKLIHGLPIENCPFDARLDYKIESARQRTLRGFVDENDFDDERLGRRAADLFEELLASTPPTEDLVFTHGDYCLPNIIIENGKLGGVIDWGSAGVADKYQDIALLTRSVSRNFGESWETSVFELYGIAPDREKISFYRLLDEFF